MSLIDCLNSNSGLITAIATVILAGVTTLYLIETREMRLEYERYTKIFVDESNKSRIEAKKPIFSFQSDDLKICNGRSLYLCNYGPIARNVSITTICRTQPQKPLFYYTIGQYERVMICGEWLQLEREKNKIIVDLKFLDADMRNYQETLTLDYNEISTDNGAIGVPVLRSLRVDCYQMNE
jgi:hypothetical protein